MTMRVTSGLIFTILFLVALFAPHMQWLMIVLMAFGTLMGMHEFMFMGSERPSAWLLALTFACGLAMLVNAYYWNFEYTILILGLAVVLELGIVTFTTDPSPGDVVSRSITSLIYVALPLSLLLAMWHALRVSPHPDSNEHYMIFLVAITWSSDSGALFMGRAIGRHKMCPSISPGKTWEGLAGGFLMCLTVAVLMKLFWNNIDRIFPSWTELIGLTLAIAAIAPIGDLAESRLKRSMGVKDSGRTFTGHGGMLDIIDSLLFTTVFFYIYMKLVHRI